MSGGVRQIGGTGWRGWLESEAPHSARQAAWGAAWRSFALLRRNRLAYAGLIALVLLVLAAIFAPLLSPCSPDVQDLAHRLAPPSAAHWLGTDELGRDLLARVLFGGRITLGMVLLVMVLVTPFGLVLGCVAGYAGGLADRVLMRVTDIFLAFPRLVLALAFVAALRPGIGSAVLAIALTAWPPYARLARADTLTIRRTDFIAAARLAGARPARIVWRHIVPLCIPAILVRATLDMSGIVLTIAGLGFLGMGAQPPAAEWGTMISASRAYIVAQWWVPAVPGVAIVVASLAFNLLGDGLRDVLDPKQR